MNGLKKAIEENRIIFFNNGRYKYVPSHTYQKKIKEKMFDSERANKLHDLKIMYREKVWKTADRKLYLIEKYVEKGLRKISNKEFIFK